MSTVLSGKFSLTEQNHEACLSKPSCAVLTIMIRKLTRRLSFLQLWRLGSPSSRCSASVGGFLAAFSQGRNEKTNRLRWKGEEE